MSPYLTQKFKARQKRTNLSTFAKGRVQDKQMAQLPLTQVNDNVLSQQITIL